MEVIKQVKTGKECVLKQDPRKHDVFNLNWPTNVRSTNGPTGETLARIVGENKDDLPLRDFEDRPELVILLLLKKNRHSNVVTLNFKVVFVRYPAEGVCEKSHSLWSCRVVAMNGEIHLKQYLIL